MPPVTAEPPHKRLRPNPYTRAGQAALASHPSSAPIEVPSSDTAALLAQSSSTPGSQVQSQEDKRRKRRNKNRKRSLNGGITSPVKATQQLPNDAAEQPGEGDERAGAIFDRLMEMHAPSSPSITGVKPGDFEMEDVPPAKLAAVGTNHSAQEDKDRDKRKKEKKEKKEKRKGDKHRGGSPSKPGLTLSPERKKEAVASSLRDNEDAAEKARLAKTQAEEKNARAARDLAQIREEARRREEHQKALQAALDEAAGWKAEAEKEKKLREEREKEFEGMVNGLEKQIEEKKEHTKSQDMVIRDHEAVKGALKEAVECGVCLMTVDDPYILSCGHMACKGCLVEWFRTAGAYQSEIFEPITPDTDLSHRVKLCHVCRAAVIRRPARVFFLRAILEPLGLYEAKDAPLPSSQMDTWDKIFPIERESYKVYDEQDGIWRCPTCGGEIDEGLCSGCGITFSDNEADVWDDDDQDSESDVMGSVLGDGPIVVEGVGRERRIPNFLDDEAEDDEGNSSSDISDSDSDMSGSSGSQSDASSSGSSVQVQRVGRARPGNQDAGSLRDRASNDPHLARIFRAVDAIQGGALNRDQPPARRADRTPAFLRSDSEAETDVEDGENDLFNAGEMAGFGSDDESDVGPPGSEDEYGGSFIDDGEEDELDEDELEEGQGGASGSEVESVTHGRRGARQTARVRGGPPPRVRRVQSDEDESDRPVFQRVRRRGQPVVISDSDSE